MKPIRWQRWLEGDVTPPRDWPRWKKVKWARFRKRLAKVGRNMNTRLWITEGPRTYADQERLYNKYNGIRPVARPGTSNHEIPSKAHNPAADVLIKHSMAPIGESKAGRAALKRFELCLPVGGEPWHVEIGDTFHA